jgi:serine/threonine protein kinase
VKPKNVLIFEAGVDSYSAKVADFGFSTYFQDEQEDLIQIPKSVPWTAPEYHKRYFTSQSAKLMDTYSFGMLCLWLLFDSTNTPFGAQNDTMSFHFKAEYWQDKEELLMSWKKDKLIDWATGLVANDASIGVETKTNLIQLFKSSLNPDTRMRMADWDRILDLLAPIQ